MRPSLIKNGTLLRDAAIRALFEHFQRCFPSVGHGVEFSFVQTARANGSCGWRWSPRRIRVGLPRVSGICPLLDDSHGTLTGENLEEIACFNAAWALAGYMRQYGRARSRRDFCRERARDAVARLRAGRAEFDHRVMEIEGEIRARSTENVARVLSGRSPEVKLRALVTREQGWLRKLRRATTALRKIAQAKRRLAKLVPPDGVEVL